MTVIKYDQKPSFGRTIRSQYFNFDPSYIPFNHGSYGTFPTPVRDYQRRLQDRIEQKSDPFIRYQIPNLLVRSRAAVAACMGAPTDDVVFVPNVTTAINTVLRNLTFQRNDVIIYFSFAYDACVKTIQEICESTPAQLYCIDVTFPTTDDDIVNSCITAFAELRHQGKNPRIQMFETVVAFPGVLLPWERLVECCRQARVLSLVDGAHGLGHIDLRGLHEVNPDFFTSNCYKWLYTPRACAVLYVPQRNHHLLRTSLPTSHGFRPLPQHGNGERSVNFAELFKWVATVDQTPYLCVPAAIAFRENVCGGEDAIRKYCFNLAQRGGDLVASRLGTEVMHSPESSLNQCCFTNVRLPIEFSSTQPASTSHRVYTIDPKDGEAVINWIIWHSMTDHNTWIPGQFYNGAAWIRLSAQIYLEMSDFEKAAEILLDLCSRVNQGQWSASEPTCDATEMPYQIA